MRINCNRTDKNNFYLNKIIKGAIFNFNYTKFLS